MSVSPDLFRSRRAVVVGEVQEAPGVKTIALRLDGDYHAEPGQFNMIYYWGVGEVPVSISSKPVRVNGYTVVEHTVRVFGAVTKALVYATGVNSVLGIRGPYGRGWPLREYTGFNILVVAGGLGLAPLRPLVKYVLENRDLYGDLYLLYGARTPQDMLFKYELDSYAVAPRTRLLLSSDVPAEGWRHHVGFVTDLINHVQLNPAETVAYICGPEVMMRVAVRELLERGYRKDRIYLSLERRMRCGVGVCGTCQLGHYFVCKDGPVFSYEELEDYFWVEGI